MTVTATPSGSDPLRWPLKRSRSLTAAMACAAVTIVCLLISASAAQAGIGDAFSFAPVSANGTTAPAFPGERAWWAGVCDLHAGEAAVGVRPGTPFPGCIDHPESLKQVGSNPDPVIYPPLASPHVVPGSSGMDGWSSLALGLVDGPGWRLADVTQAGARPDGTASFWLSRSADMPAGLNTGVRGGPDGAPRFVRVSLPPGVIANPNAVPKCPATAVNTVPTSCPPKSQVGVATITVDATTAVTPVYNVEPRKGRPAELILSRAGISAGNNSNVPVIGSVRSDDDFGVDAEAVEIPAAIPLQAQSFTIWGVPWARSHDRYRPISGYCGAPANDPTTAGRTFSMPVKGLPGGFANGCSQEGQSYDPSWGPIRPFLSTQTSCADPDPTTTIFATNWHTPVTATEGSVAPALVGCEDLTFDASFELAPTSTAADSATGLGVELSIPQNNDPPASVRHNPDDEAGAPAYWKSKAGLATAHLDDSVVTLPDGVAVNPSAASGLAGCADSEIGIRDASSNPPLFNDDDPFDGAGAVECPPASVIGTARVQTPLLDEPLTGEVVLGTPKTTNPRGEADGRRMFRMFIVVRNRDRGLIAKIYGSATADPATGQLKATFENNPQVPFDKLELDFKGGARGLLALPQGCGNHSWTSTFTPWSGGAPVVRGAAFHVDSGCAQQFAPSLQAGMTDIRARANGTFSFRFARRDGEQWLRGLTARLPTGLLASVRDVPLCSDAAANAGSCPAGSRIGIVDAKAGSGDPFVLEQKGELFLTEGYKGGEYGLAVKIRPVAGPFRGAMELSPIVVRQAIHVDRASARVTAVSDPFPLIHHGVPLRVREVTVLVDRERFMLNPSDCAPKQVGADIVSDRATTASLTDAFQAAGCAGLAFKPKLTLALSGRKQVRTGKHPGIRAQVTQRGIPEAGIERAEVRLPKSLALDVNNAQALCEFADGTKPDLENHCPKGSIVGRARAVSPLLNDPLAGNVYFVKNVRRDPKTGNEIRTLPMIIVALRGEISINLKGESDTTKGGKLVSTFASVPDAPVSRFNLNIKGGRNGILAVTRTRRARINLCARPKSHVAESDMDGHNGRRHDTDVRMKTPCTKRQTKAAKRAEKKARNAKRSASGSRSG